MKSPEHHGLLYSCKTAYMAVLFIIYTMNHPIGGLEHGIYVDEEASDQWGISECRIQKSYARKTNGSIKTERQKIGKLDLR